MKLFLAILTLLLGLNCGRTLGKNSFTSMPTRRITNIVKVKLDGVYMGNVENNGRSGVQVFCLYSNGVAVEYYLPMEVTNFDVKKGPNKERIFDTLNYIDSLYKVKQAGGFRIEGDKIQIQVFEFVNYGNYELCTYKGQIVNDSTIFISSCEIKSKSNFCPDHIDLKFYQMPKPDSANQLMNKNWYWEK